MIEYANIDVCLALLKSGAQKEEEGGPKEGTDNEGPSEKKAEETGEGST